MGHMKQYIAYHEPMSIYKTILRVIKLYGDIWVHLVQYKPHVNI